MKKTIFLILGVLSAILLNGKVFAESYLATSSQILEVGSSIILDEEIVDGKTIYPKGAVLKVSDVHYLVPNPENLPTEFKAVVTLGSVRETDNPASVQILCSQHMTRRYNRGPHQLSFGCNKGGFIRVYNKDVTIYQP